MFVFSFLTVMRWNIVSQHLYERISARQLIRISSHSKRSFTTTEKLLRTLCFGLGNWGKQKLCLETWRLTSRRNINPLEVILMTLLFHLRWEQWKNRNGRYNSDIVLNFGESEALGNEWMNSISIKHWVHVTPRCLLVLSVHNQIKYEWLVSIHHLRDNS